MKTWPKLSETLPHPKNPDTCQSCGTDGAGVVALEIWTEHDENDRPTNRVLVLCPKCSKAIIEPHPRLYSRVPENKPVPGAMRHLCLGCAKRDGLKCTHPDLKQNGGAGLIINVAMPLRGFWDGTKNGKRTGGVFESWPARAKNCAGFIQRAS